MIRDVGPRQHIIASHEDTGDVERNIAITQDHRTFTCQVEDSVDVIGVPLYQATNSVAE